MLGTITLWFGWYGFNAGSALTTKSEHRDTLTALAAVNTTLSGGMAGLVALFVNYLNLERQTGEPIFDLKVAMNGSLGGLVAITSGCGVVEPWAAVIVGAVAGLLYLAGTSLLLKMRLDDAVDAIPVHMFNGIWGLLAVGLFASPRNLELTFAREFKHVGWFYSMRNGSADAHLFAANVVAVLFIAGWITATMLPFFVWLDWKGWFRSDPLEELVGLDTSYHRGLILNSGDESVNPEYISQFRKQRAELRNRHRSAQGLPPEEKDDDFGTEVEGADYDENIL
jgi:Amt family ammonium transporter